MDPKDFELSVDERNEIKQRVNFELNNLQFKIIPAGGFINSLAALWLVWVLRKQVDLFSLLIWMGLLLIINGYNIHTYFRYKFSNITFKQFVPWRKKFHCVVCLLSLTWGWVGILYVGNNAGYRMFVFSYLLVALVAFVIGTITDLVASLVSLICLVSPYICYHIYWGNYLFAELGKDNELNFAFAGDLFFIGLFLLLVSFLGHKMVADFFKLTFVNEELKKRLEVSNETLRHQATHDSLTQLANRTLLYKLFPQLANDAKKLETQIAILFLDLDDFKQINDQLGHEVGDKLLQHFANQLVRSVREGDVVVRLGGDEMAILLNNIDDRLEVQVIVERILSNLSSPFSINGNDLEISSSIGVSFFPKDGEDIGELLKVADYALYRAKTIKKGSVQYYNPVQSPN